MPAVVVDVGLNSKETEMNASNKKIRVLLTKSQLDGHDRGVRYLARKLREAGIEVIFTRYRSPGEIVNSALQEDVDVIGISFSVGGHSVISGEVIKSLQEKGMDNIPLIIGGIIPGDDMSELLGMGVSGVFGPGSCAGEVVEHIRTHVAKDL